MARTIYDDPSEGQDVALSSVDPTPGWLKSGFWVFFVLFIVTLVVLIIVLLTKPEPEIIEVTPPVEELPPEQQPLTTDLFDLNNGMPEFEYPLSWDVFYQDPFGANQGIRAVISPDPIHLVDGEQFFPVMVFLQDRGFYLGEQTVEEFVAISYPAELGDFELTKIDEDLYLLEGRDPRGGHIFHEYMYTGQFTVARVRLVELPGVDIAEFDTIIETLDFSEVE